MKIKTTPNFREKVKSQINIISSDKPSVARKIKKVLGKRILDIPTRP